MTWTVKRIMEDDYGCEERTEEDLDQVIVLLENEKGESISVKAGDSVLVRREIDEGSAWPEDLLPDGKLKAGL
jgi:hypothetical protein